MVVIYVMPIERSPKRDKAFELYRDNKGDMMLKEIAADLELKRFPDPEVEEPGQMGRSVERYYYQSKEQ